MIVLRLNTKKGVFRQNIGRAQDALVVLDKLCKTHKIAITDISSYTFRFSPDEGLIGRRIVYAIMVGTQMARRLYNI